MAKIGIIGGGFAGLGAAYFLKNHDVTIIESEDHLGGLAEGLKLPEWNWSIEYLIHHWFETDKFILDIANNIGLGKKIIIKNTKSSCFYNNKIIELDSPFSLLKFPYLSIIDRIRTGMVMGFLRFDKNYLRYENQTSYDFIKKYMGQNAFKVLWEPLFIGKFGKYADRINATWFWARINPRTKNLAYIGGGMNVFIDKLKEEIEKNGTKIITKSPVRSIEKKNGAFIVKTKKKTLNFDIIICCTPIEVSSKIIKGFSKEERAKLMNLKTIGAQYFLIELKNKFLEDGTYWLNINEKNFPFMMVAEHTNFVDNKNYNRSKLIWVGKYLDKTDPLWKLSKEELLEKIIPYLKKINPKFEKSWIKNVFFKRYDYAQPIVELNYSKNIPNIKSSIEGLYLISMNHIYPLDRGTNQAIKLGYEVAKKIKDQL
jgi:protoporphyrinogen oxidase